MGYFVRRLAIDLAVGRRHTDISQAGETHEALHLGISGIVRRLLQLQEEGRNGSVHFKVGIIVSPVLDIYCAESVSKY